MLQLNNYIIYQGHIAKVSDLKSETLSFEVNGELIWGTYDDIRFMEITEERLLQLREGDRPLATRVTSNTRLFHTRQNWELNFHGKKFYMYGLLFEQTTIWQFSNLITLHYVHQLQNLTSILNPQIQLTLV